MKIALLGKGKTGGKVIELINDNNLPHTYTVFDRSNPMTVEQLRLHDVILSFLPGDAFVDNIEIIKTSGIPVVTGSTGFKWTDELIQGLTAPWVYATNFSLGMNLVHEMINTLSKARNLFNDYSFSIHEVHHTKKLDAPSGTALTWKDWVNDEVEITSERTGDVIGDHILTFTTANEKITLRHEALDRKIFAEGALWACEKVRDLNIGLHNFQSLSLKELLK